MGQDVALKLSAFNQRVTPELNGVVNEISADLSVDERSGAGFYTVRVSLPRTGPDSWCNLRIFFRQFSL
ncbi:HlyD family secretion protein [Mesorhizobium loti]|uniref:HlyD family secretion protein n=1 Tax=Rhizobium loti TaxID=381 RepID=UPI0004AE677B